MITNAVHDFLADEVLHISVRNDYAYGIEVFLLKEMIIINLEQ